MAKKNIKSHSKTAKKVGGKTRYQLDNSRLAKATAKAKTSIMKRESFRTQRRIDEAFGKGDSLKEGILSMATMAQPPKAIRDKLRKMDPDKLAAMYSGNETAFEIFYSYENIEYIEGYGYIVDDSKQDDIAFFVSEYERLFGALE